MPNDNLASTAPKPFVFVLMPFSTDFDDLYKYGIKGATADAGAFAERLDEQIFAEGMLDRIFSQINKADVIVADMTGRNPNVFYEVGYAHALQKVVLLVTRHAEDIPFDLKHHQHIVYGGSIDTLKNQLTRKLLWAIGESRRVDSAVKITLIDVYDRMAPTKIPFQLKVYCAMRNDSNRVIDVRISPYMSNELKVISNTPGALQLQFQPGGDWSPDPSTDNVAVLPGQTFRAWIAPDEALFNKASFERLRGQMGKGQMGTLILNVDGQEFPRPL
jgi:hypothetical protein